MLSIKSEDMKRHIGTRVEDDVYSRIERLAAHEFSQPSAIVRRLVMRNLETLEREILGEQFVGGIKSAPVQVPESEATQP